MSYQSITDRRFFASHALRAGLHGAMRSAQILLDIEKGLARSPDAQQLYSEMVSLINRAIAILPPEPADYD